MLRITVVSQTGEEAVLKVEGWVSEENVELLKQEGTRCLRKVGCLVLDLANVKYIDDAGIALLQRWPGERLKLRGGSPFMRMLLRTHGLV